MELQNGLVHWKVQTPTKKCAFFDLIIAGVALSDFKEVGN